MDDKSLREHLRRVLSWHEAHLDWKKALADLPAELRGRKPKGAPHSAWQLLEHARIAQRDMLEFCCDPKHISPDWPSGYWPEAASPPSAADWENSVRRFEEDTEATGKLVADPKTDIFAPIPHGSGQTVLREVLLIADHNSYHLGQFVLLRRLLGSWPET
jgi:DinB superfamily